MTSFFAQSRAVCEVFLDQLRRGQHNSSTLRILRVRQATPPWADKAAIRAKYAEARRLNKEHGPRSYCVDHIIPICGDLVSGLHVSDNLRVVPSWINAKKQNRFDGKRKNPWGQLHISSC